MITKRQFSILVVVALLLGAGSVQADDYQDTINVFRKAEESGNFFGKAHGYAVFPHHRQGRVDVRGSRDRTEVQLQAQVSACLPCQ